MYCEKCGKEIAENEKCSCNNVVESKQETVKPKSKKTLIIVIAAVCGFLVTGGIVGAILLGSVFNSGDEEIINIVKNGYFEEMPEPTVGEAFEEFFADPEWTSFTTDEGETAVEFNGVCTLDGEEADCCIQFKVFEDNSFETYYVEIDGETLSEEDVITMYETIYGYEYVEGSANNSYIETPTITSPGKPSENVTESATETVTESATQTIVSKKTFNMTFNEFMSQYNNSLSADSLASFLGATGNDKSKLETFGNEYKIMGEDINFNAEERYYIIPMNLFDIRVSVNEQDFVEECTILCPVNVQDDGLKDYILFCDLMVHAFEPDQNLSYCHSIVSKATKNRSITENGIKYSMSEDSSCGYFKISPAE